jgi:hypothetical protein
MPALHSEARRKYKLIMTTKFSDKTCGHNLDYTEAMERSPMDVEYDDA